MDGGMMGGGMMGGGGMNAFTAVWVLLAVVLTAVAVVAVVWAVRSAEGRDRRRVGGASSARQRLDERYARGDIDRDEFLQRREDLSGA